MFIHAMEPESYSGSSQKVFINQFCKIQFPYKSVNLSCIITNIENKLTDLCGNRLLKNDCINMQGLGVVRVHPCDGARVVLRLDMEAQLFDLLLGSLLSKTI